MSCAQILLCATYKQLRNTALDMDGNRKELMVLVLILIALNDSGSLTIQLTILSVSGRTFRKGEIQFMLLLLPSAVPT